MGEGHADEVAELFVITFTYTGAQKTTVVVKSIYLILIILLIIIISIIIIININNNIFNIFITIQHNCHIKNNEKYQ